MPENHKTTLLLVLLSLTWFQGISQIRKDSLNIYGDWKCIKHDYRGIEKFTFQQAEEIRKSVLHIEATTYYFKHITFITKCPFYAWRLKPYEPDDIAMIDRIFTKAQLKQIFLLDPARINGDDTCYNDCVILKKRNILITNCGGYIFYWVKVKPK